MDRGRLLALVLAAVGCGGGQPSRTAAAQDDTDDGQPPARGLIAGERASYRVTLAGVEVGEVAFAVGRPGEVDGRAAIVVASRASAAGLARLVRQVAVELETTIDATTEMPGVTHVRFQWGPRRYRGEFAFAGDGVEGAWYRDEEIVFAVQRDAGDVPLHNVHSAVAAVRAWHGVPGERRAVHVFGGINVWRVDLTWVGHEIIGTTRGNLPAVRIDGASQLGNLSQWRVTFSAWFSDDADRVPLRVLVRVSVLEGAFELVDYDQGFTSAKPAGRNE